MLEPDGELGQPIGALTDVKVSGVRHNMVFYQSGLLLLDQTGADTKQLRRILATTTGQVLLRSNRFISFSDVSHVKILKDIPVKATLDLTGGGQVEVVERWVSASLGDDDRTLFKDLLLGLRNTGPMPEAAAAEAARTWVEDAAVLDAMGNVTVNGMEYDLIVLDVGLVFVADPGESQRGKTRLTNLLEGTTLPEIVGHNWLVRYEQVVAAKITKSLPVAAELELYDGLQLMLKESWSGQSLADNTRDVVIAALCSVGAVKQR